MERRAKDGSHARKSAARAETVEDRRTAERHSITVAADVSDVGSGVHITGRVCDLSIYGCYVDTLNPFPVGTSVRVRFSKAKSNFATTGKVIYSTNAMGMGIAFAELTPEGQSLLKSLIAEPAFADDLGPQAAQLPDAELSSRSDRALVTRLIELLVQKRILSETEMTVLLRDPLP